MQSRQKELRIKPESIGSFKIHTPAPRRLCITWALYASCIAGWISNHPSNRKVQRLKSETRILRAMSASLMMKDVKDERGERRRKEGLLSLQTTLHFIFLPFIVCSAAHTQRHQPVISVSYVPLRLGGFRRLNKQHQATEIWCVPGGKFIWCSISVPSVVHTGWLGPQAHCRLLHFFTGLSTSYFNTREREETLRK